MRADLIEVYKIVHGHSPIAFDDFFEFDNILAEQEVILSSYESIDVDWICGCTSSRKGL